MNRILPVLLLILIGGKPAMAQTTEKERADSLRYYQQQMSHMRIALLDSLQKSDTYIRYQERVKELVKTSPDYAGVLFTTEIVHSDYAKLNNSIAADGFDPIPENMFRIGLGITNHSDQFIVDMQYFVAGFKSQSKKGEEKISMSLTSALQTDIGYDLVKADWLELFPFAGLSLRLSGYSYEKPVTVNPSSTNISNLVLQNQSVESFSTKLGYQAGAGISVRVSPKASDDGILFLMAKFGTNRPFGKERYKFDDIRLSPGTRQGLWVGSLGIKLVGRN